MTAGDSSPTARGRTRFPYYLYFTIGAETV
jgi:hypothetical protein